MIPYLKDGNWDAGMVAGLKANKAVVRIVVNINYREAEVLSYPELTG